MVTETGKDALKTLEAYASAVEVYTPHAHPNRAFEEGALFGIAQTLVAAGLVPLSDVRAVLRKYNAALVAESVEVAEDTVYFNHFGKAKE